MPKADVLLSVISKSKLQSAANTKLSTIFDKNQIINANKKLVSEAVFCVPSLIAKYKLIMPNA